MMAVFSGPDTCEAAISLLALGIGNIERHPPTSRAEIARVRLLITRLETAANVAARRMETVE